MLSAPCPRKRARSGQAIAELLPSFMIFFMVMTAGLSYFKLMRAATIRQEVVRNLAFAKINNSGTLTTPSNQIGPNGATGLLPLNLASETGMAPPRKVVQAGNNSFLSAQTSCFSVFPDEALMSMPMGQLLMGDDLGTVDFRTYAVVYRSAGGSCP